MKKLILIDFNGVISYQPFWNSIYSDRHHLFELSKNLNDFLFIENKEYIKEWMLGLHTSEDVHDFIAKKFKINKEELWNIFESDAKNLDISNPILNELMRLKKSFHVVLLSDNMDTFYRFTLPSNPELSKTFDGMFISYNIGRLKKTDGGSIYKDVAKVFETELGDTIYIDDSQSNCDLFNSLGGKAYCLTGEKNIVDFLKTL